MSWFRKWWVYLVASVAGLVAFFFACRRDEKIPIADAVEKKRRERELARAREEVELGKELQRGVERLDAARVKALEEAKKKVGEDTHLAEGDTEKVNSYLREVDKWVRGEK